MSARALVQAGVFALVVSAASGVAAGTFTSTGRPRLAELQRFAVGKPVDLGWSGEHLVVLDAAAGTLSFFDSRGALVQRVGGTGSAPGQLSAPSAMAIDDRGQIYVADTGNDRIEVFGADGGHQRSIGGPGARPREFRQPSDVELIDSDFDGLVVADRGNNRVQMLDVGRGRGDQFFEFADPVLVAYSRSDGLIIGDRQGSLRALSSGSPARLQPIAGFALLRKRMSLTAVSGIAVGDDERLWVLDRDRARLLEIAPDWSLRREVELPHPALAIAESRRRELPALFVADGHSVVELGFPVDSPLPVFEKYRAALERGDIEGALRYIHPFERPRMRETLAIIRAKLPEEVRRMKDVHVETLRENEATLVIETVEDGQPVGYPVRCVRMPDGSWTIVDY